jgi:hypothetical protein
MGNESFLVIPVLRKLLLPNTMQGANALGECPICSIPKKEEERGGRWARMLIGCRFSAIFKESGTD